jgi:ADP-ribose pyrophosphatase
MKRKSKKVVYEGRIFSLLQEEWVDDEGRVFLRDIIIHPGAVGVLAFSKKREIVLLKQFRPAVSDYLWEIPAGLLDKKEENPLSTARRELKEETGYTASSWKKLATFYTTPGCSDETFHLFGAWNLTKGKSQIEEGEDITKVGLFFIDEALEMVKSGKIKDGKTVIAVFFAYFIMENEAF